MFSKEKINTGRQPELDIARGLAVLFMIVIHVQIYFANAGVIDTYFADFNDFMGDIPAAPMFMLLLGIGINYSSKANPALLAKRGIGLLLTAYLLNFVRGFVPYLLRSYVTADIGYVYTGFTELIYVDILQFSGLAMIMFAIFQKLNFNKIAIAFTCIAFAVLNLFMLNIEVDSYALRSLTGLFWGSSENTFFPFLTWMFYPIAGYLFGSLLIRCKNKRKFYLITGIIGAVVFFGGGFVFTYLLEIPTGMQSEMGYYHHFITDNITFTGGVLLEIALLSVIAPYLPKFVHKIGARWSKNVTPLFCIHWVIITWLTLIIPNNSLSLGLFIALLLAVIALSDITAILYAKWKSTEMAKRTPVVIPILAITLVLGILATSLLPVLPRYSYGYEGYYEYSESGD